MRRVLLIEDEPAVSQVFTAVFRRLNFEILTAGVCVRLPNAAACGFECCVQWAKPDLAVIGSCSGLDSARKALALWPTLKLLLTSASPIGLWPEPIRRKYEMLASTWG